MLGYNSIFDLKYVLITSRSNHWDKVPGGGAMNPSIQVIYLFHQT